MQNVTLMLAAIGSVLVLVLRPARALCAYMALLIWYPDYLRVSLGTLDISAGRIVVLVLLLRCLFSDQIRGTLVWHQLDTLVALSMAVYVGVYCVTRPLGTSVENRGGFLMDTWLVYLVTRFCLRDPNEITEAIKIIALVIAPLAILGVFESVTGKFVFRELHQYCPWRSDVPIVQGRWGFTRAQGPFSHAIMFGSCFVTFLPLILNLRYERGGWRRLGICVAALALAGAISSFSSSSWSMLAVMLLCLFMQRYSRWLKPLTVGFICLMLVLQIVSNRPFYHVLYHYMNFAGGVWYQRVVIVDKAIADFGEWWLVGYGGRDPGWGAAVGMKFTDLNNEFILAGVNYGLLGMVMLIAVLVKALGIMARSYRMTDDKQCRSMFWGLGSIVVSTCVIWQGVSYFGQMTSIFYIVLGMIGSAQGLAGYARTNELGRLRSQTCMRRQEGLAAFK